METAMSGNHLVTEAHLQEGIDAILGIDPSQAPTDPSELAERLSIAQPGVVHSLQMLVGSPNGRKLGRAAPLVFSMLEAAALAHPERFGELSSKSFATSILSASGDAKAFYADPPSPAASTLEERQPALLAFVRQYLDPEGALVKSLSKDERMSVAALLFGTLRAIDRHFDGAGQPVQSTREPGRNEPCHCGSGKKYKKCHGAPV